MGVFIERATGRDDIMSRQVGEHVEAWPEMKAWLAMRGIDAPKEPNPGDWVLIAPERGIWHVVAVMDDDEFREKFVQRDAPNDVG